MPDSKVTGSDLRELVIVHAGNPEDGCCGVWIGAPIPADEVNVSPWHWITPLWCIERSVTGGSLTDRAKQQRHDQLPEPEVAVEAREIAATEDQSE